jgi:hypothetical protein
MKRKTNLLVGSRYLPFKGDSVTRWVFFKVLKIKTLLSVYALKVITVLSRLFDEKIQIIFLFKMGNLQYLKPFARVQKVLI